MIYVYDVRSFKDGDVQDLINNELAVALDPDDLTKVLSKFETLGIGEETITPDEKLEEWLEYCDGGQYINIDLPILNGGSVQRLQPSMEEAIRVLQNYLYLYRGDKNPVFADRIYNSKNPIDEIYRILQECLLTVIEMMIQDLKCALTRIDLSIKNNEFEWK